jgi:hypothetical protein
MISKKLNLAINGILSLVESFCFKWFLWTFVPPGQPSTSSSLIVAGEKYSNFFIAWRFVEDGLFLEIQEISKSY